MHEFINKIKGDGRMKKATGISQSRYNQNILTFPSICQNGKEFIQLDCYSFLSKKHKIYSFSCICEKSVLCSGLGI